MIYGLYQSAAGMMVNDHRQGVLANNLANAETVGFKRDIATFAERIPASEAGRRFGPSSELLEPLTGGVWQGRTETDFSEGSFVKTDNPLDVAIAGPGFLQVAHDGQQYLTRDGRMTLNADGWLVSAADGSQVLGAGGAPIRLNPRTDISKLAIDEDGRITVNNRQVARLEVVDAADYDALRKVGGGRIEAGETELLHSPAKIVSKHTESSGVEPIKELVTMIEASRAYQFNAQMISLQDKSAGTLINAVANT